MTPSTKALLLTLITVFTSCKGQVKPSPLEVSNAPKANPIVVKNVAAVAMAPDFDTTLVSQYIRSIFQDSKGNMWFGTIGEGVVRYDIQTLRYFSQSDGLNSTTVHAINEDKSGNMWFGTDQGVYKYDGKTFRNYHQKDGLDHIDMSRRSILVDKSGAVWVGTHSGVYTYDPLADISGSRCFSLFPLLPSINIADIVEDKNGHIWFASSDKGVFRYDGKTIVNYHDKAGLGENYAGGIAQDPSGNMWFTMKNGICKFDGKTFTEYTPKDGISGTEFWGIIVEQSGIVWVTARGCTTRFDPSLDKANPMAMTVFRPEDGLNCCVQSMYQDRSGNMWWGAGSGLYRFDGQHFYQVKQTGPW
jgi:ligand-binding sensor domain-containing protein